MRTRRVQDKAWAIDLHLVKHSGMGKAAAVLGGEKVRLVGSNFMFSFLSFLKTSVAKFEEDLASFQDEYGSSTLGFARLALQTARCWWRTANCRAYNTMSV